MKACMITGVMEGVECLLLLLFHRAAETVDYCFIVMADQPDANTRASSAEELKCVES